MLREADRLRSMARGQALSIAFGDTKEGARRITVFPDHPILIGYEGAADEAAAREIVERCARVLDYEAVSI